MLPVVPATLGRCRLGVGRADITPPADSYHRNWGAALHDAAEGVHRPLTATVVAFADDAGALRGLFTVDLGWLRAREMSALLVALRAGSGLSADDLVFTLSHTHAAINLDVERTAEPGGQHIEPYLAALPGKLLAAWQQARDSLQPVDLAVAHGRCALAMHRDARDEDRGIYVCGPNPDGDSDDTVTVLRATDAQGRPLAHLVNYACHPTTLAWDNRLISPDYVGALREVVETSTGVPCAFLQGPSGDLGPVRGFVGDVETADSNGRQLGHAVLAALETLPAPGKVWAYREPVVSGATVGAWEWQAPDTGRATGLSRFETRTVTLSLAHRQLPTREELDARLADWRQKQAAGESAGDEEAVREARARIERLRRALRLVEAQPADGHVDYEVRLWRLGEVVLVMVGGEPYQQLQVNLRRRFPATRLLVVELCNRPHSYLLPRERYGIGLYQEEVCVLAPGCLEAVEEAAAAVLDEWQLT